MQNYQQVQRLKIWDIAVFTLLNLLPSWLPRSEAEIEVNKLSQRVIVVAMMHNFRDRFQFPQRGILSKYEKLLLMSMLLNISPITQMVR